MKASSDFETSTLVREIDESMSAKFKSPETKKRQRLIAMQKAFGYDDWCMCIGIVCLPPPLYTPRSHPLILNQQIPFLALTIVCLVGPFHGVGVHQASLTADQQTQGRLWFFLFEILFCITIIFIKLSISFMLGKWARSTTRTSQHWSNV